MSKNVMTFTGRFDNMWEVPLGNLKTARWDYDVCNQEDELMEQIFTATVKDIHDNELVVSIDILIHPDGHLTYCGVYISDDDDHEVDNCSIDGKDIATEDACDRFGIVPKSYEELKNEYNN